MSLRVVGAGLGRTGTHSLKLALETLLDAPCYHMMEIRDRPNDADVWRRAAEGETLNLTQPIEGYAATVDWPTAAFWHQLSQENPDALILLSTRASSEEWWESANSTIFEVSRQMDPGPVYHMLNSLFPSTFTADFSDHDAAIAAYDAHNAAVRRHAPADRLVEWRPGDGWQPLCDALGTPAPDQPFPHSNARDDFRQRRGWDSQHSSEAKSDGGFAPADDAEPESRTAHPRSNRRLTMTPEASIALIESFWQEVWAARNPAAIDGFVTDDFIITTAGVDVAGRENFKAWVADFQSKIADLKIETIETFANLDGSRVSSRWRVTGRNNGMFGLPADGKPVAFTGNAILAVTQTGKIAHNWVERSAWELYNQLKA